MPSPLRESAEGCPRIGWAGFDRPWLFGPWLAMFGVEPTPDPRRHPDGDPKAAYHEEPQAPPAGFTLDRMRLA